MDLRRSVNFLTTTFAIVAADLGSKAWALRTCIAPKVLIAHRLSCVLAMNPHGMMGMLREVPDAARRSLLVGVSLLAIVGIVAMAARTRPAQHGMRLALALVLGGAVGNLVDRLRLGAVVDFIDVVYRRNAAGFDVHWHTFNVADVAIAVGVALLSLEALRTRQAEARLPQQERRS